MRHQTPPNKKHKNNKKVPNSWVFFVGWGGLFGGGRTVCVTAEAKLFSSRHHQKYIYVGVSPPRSHADLRGAEPRRPRTGRSSSRATIMLSWGDMPDVELHAHLQPLPTPKHPRNRTVRSAGKPIRSAGKPIRSAHSLAAAEIASSARGA